MINLVEILKDAPQGLKLYSPLCGECFLKHSKGDNITVCCDDETTFTFTKEGRFYTDKGECLLFPSKDRETWGYWQEFLFRKDDMVYSLKTNETYKFFKFSNGFQKFELFDSENQLYIVDTMLDFRFATSEEIELYDKKTPLKKGEWIVFKDINGHDWYDCCQIVNIDDKFYHLRDMSKKNKEYTIDFVERNYVRWTIANAHKGQILKSKFNGDMVMFNSICDEKSFYSSVMLTSEENIHLTIEENRYTSQAFYPCFDDDVKLFMDNLRDNGYEIKNDLNIVKTKKTADFEPYQKVLCRCSDTDLWCVDLYGFYADDKREYPYRCVGNVWNQCIPYNNETKSLLGTKEKCDEKYKTWKTI